jgi:hypothetical protein
MGWQRSPGGHSPFAHWRVMALEARVAELEGPRPSLDDVKARLDRNAPLTRAEAAAFLGFSTKMLQRMEAAGKLRRCPGFGTAVRYAARDVLRLASAS